MRLISAIAVLTSMALVLVGCGGGKPYDPGTDNPPSTGFSIGAVPGQTVPFGGTAVFPITVYKMLIADAFGGEGDVTLSVSGVPDFASSSFTTNPVTPTFDGTATELDVATAVPSKVTNGGGPITYDLTITGTDGVETHSVTTTLTIGVVAGDDFTISVPSDRTVPSDSTANFPITITRTGNQGKDSREALPVTLTFTGGQGGSTTTFTKNPVLPTFSGAKTRMDVQTAFDSFGDYPITITASDGVHTHSAITTLHVTDGGGGEQKMGR